jgi:hypothetical protein
MAAATTAPARWFVAPAQGSSDFHAPAAQISAAQVPLGASGGGPVVIPLPRPVALLATGAAAASALEGITQCFPTTVRVK